MPCIKPQVGARLGIDLGGRQAHQRQAVAQILHVALEHPEYLARRS